MKYSPIELESYVRMRGPDIAQAIQQAAQKSRNEADLVAQVEDVLKEFEELFGLNFRLERERTLVNGRADAIYNRFVVEYEPPGSLRKESSWRQNQHAVEQVRQYVSELELAEGHAKERLAGVVLDGSFYIFVRYRDGRWYVDDPAPVTTHSTETFLRYLLSLSTELALTPDNLVRNFGAGAAVARLCVSAFYRALTASDNPKVKILFEQWQRQFGEVCGYEAGSRQLDVEALAKSYDLNKDNLDALRLFFAIHTYYATFIKLLAVQVTQYYLMPEFSPAALQLVTFGSEPLRNYLKKMEHGGVFADYGIQNFLEGDFFGWYLDIWGEALDVAVRRLIADLSNYSLMTLDVDPEETRDLLKRLYQNLVPKRLRHDLGEYYTPDWLVERLLNQLGVAGDPTKRLLDPSCGSGTFLVLAVKRIRKYAEDHALPPGDVLEQILQNVVGFDLNPLAVISARANYLLALGELLPHRKGEISLPVYLADSIMTPSAPTYNGGQVSFLAEGGQVQTTPAYTFSTVVGRFTLPQSLVSTQRIEKLADVLEDSVESRLEDEAFRRRLLMQFSNAHSPFGKKFWKPGGLLVKELALEEQEIVMSLFVKLKELADQGINGIWARIIKNAFAPLFQKDFDYVAGNPPWINWESLPKEYRQGTAPLWQRYNLFAHKGYDAILGKAKDDISILLTYVALDSYLKPEGRLGFVITQSVFKTAGAGQGFRRFRLPSPSQRGEVGVKVVHVDDLSELQIFEGATNRTAVVILEKGRPTKYPVPYTLWRKTAAGRLGTRDTLKEVLATTAQRRFVAEPVDEKDITSSWISGRPRALQAARNIIGQSDYEARAGVCTWLNSVFWVELAGQRPDGLVVVRNLTEGAKRIVEKTQAPLETDLLYPLLRGRDVDRWQARPSAHIIVTHEKSMGLKAISPSDMGVRFPKTYAYLRQFEIPLRERSGYKRYFRETDPFYSVFNVGDYTFAPYKVVWREQAARLTVAVAESGDKVMVPDHKLMMVACASRNQAHYLCAVLNSAPAEFVVASYAVAIQMDTHILEHLNIPRYDSADATHRRLATLSQRAHAAASAEDAAKLTALEAEIDHLAAQLWGLGEAELKDIQESLAELE